MSKLSLFPGLDEKGRRLGEIRIPTHTCEALDSYFLKGYNPGNFVSSILINNLRGAVNSADIANRHAIYEITKWLTTDPIVPEYSFGCVELFTDWLQDTNNVRTIWVDKFEKEYIWETLKG
jgi:hypothetical protein